MVSFCYERIYIEPNWYVYAHIYEFDLLKNLPQWYPRHIEILKVYLSNFTFHESFILVKVTETKPWFNSKFLRNSLDKNTTGFFKRVVYEATLSGILRTRWILIEKSLYNQSPDHGQL